MLVTSAERSGYRIERKWAFDEKATLAFILERSKNEIHLPPRPRHAA